MATRRLNAEQRRQQIMCDLLVNSALVRWRLLSRDADGVDPVVLGRAWTTIAQQSDTNPSVRSWLTKHRPPRGWTSVSVWRCVSSQKASSPWPTWRGDEDHRFDIVAVEWPLLDRIAGRLDEEHVLQKESSALKAEELRDYLFGHRESPGGETVYRTPELEEVRKTAAALRRLLLAMKRPDAEGFAEEVLPLITKAHDHWRPRRPRTSKPKPRKGRTPAVEATLGLYDELNKGLRFQFEKEGPIREIAAKIAQYAGWTDPLDSVKTTTEQIRKNKGSKNRR